jgi:hypothetical protein
VIISVAIMPECKRAKEHSAMAATKIQMQFDEICGRAISHNLKNTTFHFGLWDCWEI